MKQGDETISDRTRLQDRVRLRSNVITDPVGRKEVVLSENQALQVATECNCSPYDVYIESLNSGICPHRYLRNREIISLEEQLKLANSLVTVMGAGGLGGHVLLKLIVDGVTLGIASPDKWRIFRNVAFYIGCWGLVAIAGVFLRSLAERIGDAQAQVVTDHVSDFIQPIPKQVLITGLPKLCSRQARKGGGPQIARLSGSVRGGCLFQ